MLDHDYDINKLYIYVIDRNNESLSKKKIFIENKLEEFENKYSKKVEDPNISFFDLLSDLKIDEIWKSKLKGSFRHIRNDHIYNSTFDDLSDFSENSFREIFYLSEPDFLSNDKSVDIPDNTGFFVNFGEKILIKYT